MEEMKRTRKWKRERKGNRKRGTRQEGIQAQVRQKGTNKRRGQGNEERKIGMKEMRSEYNTMALQSSTFV